MQLGQKAKWFGLLLTLTIFAAACTTLVGGPYEHDFERAATWAEGTEEFVIGRVTNGVYEMNVLAESGIYWSTAAQDFGDGIYSVEATQTAGPLDNGYGMMFKMNAESDDFYLFEVSGDGFVWIGRCDGACEDNIEFLAGSGWFESDSVKQGLDATNELTVVADGGQMTFMVNGAEVASAFDDNLTSGDIGIMVETLGAGGVIVEFDNFSYTPAE